MEPLVSVITPTVRLEGLDIVHKSLEKQTYKNWEWLVGSKIDPHIKEAIWVEDNFSGGIWTLNRIYNKLIKKAHGKIIMSLQDWIWIHPDTIQKFIDDFEQMGDIIISGVGDQYEKLDEWGKPQVKIWSDPRRNNQYGSFYEIFPQDVEWNLCALPKKFLLEVGGFDEALDKYYGMDGYQVNARMDVLKHQFYIDQGIESLTLRHGRESYGGEDNWNKNNNMSNGNYQKRKDELIKSGMWPKLKYLSSK